MNGSGNYERKSVLPQKSKLEALNVVVKFGYMLETPVVSDSTRKGNNLLGADNQQGSQ